MSTSPGRTNQTTDNWEISGDNARIRQPRIPARIARAGTSLILALETGFDLTGCGFLADEIECGQTPFAFDCDAAPRFELVGVFDAFVDLLTDLDGVYFCG